MRDIPSMLLLAACIALSFATGAAATTTATTTTPAATSTVAPTTQRTLQECLAGNNRLEVLFLIDESKSLRETDAGDARVGGVKAALAGLDELTKAGDPRRRPVVDVLFASFAGDVRPDPFDEDAAQGTWEPLKDDTFSALQERADLYAERDSGHNTDYFRALRAAHELLARRSSELTSGGGPPPCKLLVWFTDGGYTVDGGPAAVKRGMTELCRRNGIADELATDGVVLLTFALRSRLLGDGADDRLRALTEGSGGNVKCGAHVNEGTGLFRPVADSSALYLDLGDLLDAHSQRSNPEPCMLVPCQEGRVEFRTVQGVTRFVIRATTGAAGIVIDLARQNGPSIRLSPGGRETQMLKGVSVKQTWVSKTDVRIEGRLGAVGDPGIGRWWFAFVDPVGTHQDAQPAARVQVFADLLPRLAPGTVLVRGETNQVRYTIRDQAGRAVTSGPLVDAAKLNLTYTDPVLHVTHRAVVKEDGPGRFVAAVPIPGQSPAGQYSLEADLSFAETGKVVVMHQQQTDFVTAKLPADQGYPTVEPVQLDLPAIDDEGSSHGTLVVKGSKIGGGCVWFGPARVTLPDDDGEMTLKVDDGLGTRSDCRQVERGASVPIPITVTVTKAFTGRASAALPVFLASDSKHGVARLQVDVGVNATKSPDTSVLWAVFIGLALLAVIIPFALLWFLNWWTGTFTPGQRVQTRAMDVRLANRGVLLELVDNVERAPDVRARTFRVFSSEPGGGGRRTMEIDGRFRLRTVASFGPRKKLAGIFLGPYGIGSVPGKRVIAGAQQPLQRLGDQTELPLALPGTWMFFPTRRASGEDGPLIEGRLLLLASGHRSQEGAELLAAAHNGIAALLHDGVVGAADDGSRDEGGRWRGLLDRLKSLSSRWPARRRGAEPDESSESRAATPPDDVPSTPRGSYLR